MNERWNEQAACIKKWFMHLDRQVGAGEIERWRDRDMHPCQWLVLKGGVNMDSTAAAGGSCTFPDFIFVFVRNKLTISRSKTLPSSKSRFVENIWTDFNLRFVFFNFFPGHRANSTTCAKIGSAAGRWHAPDWLCMINKSQRSHQHACISHRITIKYMGLYKKIIM